MKPPGQCQAMSHLLHQKYDSDGKPVLPKFSRCDHPAIIRDPRGPSFCWVHHKAFNNPSRSKPLPLHKSVTG